MSVATKELKFGTGGIRAVMGPDPDQLNTGTVRKATEGYARYLEAIEGTSVVIAYDNRKHSVDFAEEAARVLSGHGIKVYLFDSLRPTPELSFAVRYLKASGGIVITASHNPPEYNGYKIYDATGCQCVPRDTDQIIWYINQVGESSEIEIKGRPELIEKELSFVDEAYYEELLSVRERGELPKNIKIVYTPLHGAGYIPVSTMLKRLGYSISLVNEQCAPDGDFSNTKSPNPEDKVSFEKAIEIAREEEADLIIATDPDCDRIGIVVKHGDDYRYLTGNQTGAIFLQYIIEAKIEKGTLPKNAIVFNTIVTSDLGTRICNKYQIEVESTLTGFKYIGDKIREYEGKKTLLFGYEESYGYLIKDFARDKDGVQAAIMAAEVCDYYKIQGKSLVDVLDDIYREYGYCEDVQLSEIYKGQEGQEKIRQLVEDYRNGDLKELEGRRIVAKEDYLTSEKTDEYGNKTVLSLPRSNVIKYYLEDGSWVVIRPSGNEPKIKYYKNLWKEQTFSANSKNTQTHTTALTQRLR